MYLISEHELHLKDLGVAGAYDEKDTRPFIVGYFVMPVIPSRSKRSSKRSIVEHLPISNNGKILCA